MYGMDKILNNFLVLSMWFGGMVALLLGLSVLHEYHHNHILVYRPTRDIKTVSVAAAKAIPEHRSPVYRLPQASGIDRVWIDTEGRIVSALDRSGKVVKKRVKTARHKLAQSLAED